jgi:hypothetical protein|nr:MAG TPA_asm: hypothetical protein [Caudoviricetes sp.]
MLNKDLLLIQNKITDNTLSIISDPDPNVYHLVGRIEVAVIDGQNVPLPITIEATIGDRIQLHSIKDSRVPDLVNGSIQLSKNSFGITVVETDSFNGGGTIEVTALPAVAYVALY